MITKRVTIPHRKRSPRPLGAEQLSHIFEQLSLLLSSGITPEEGLSIMLCDKDNANLTDALQSINAPVQQGSTLSEAMRQSEYYPSYSVELLSIGELSGRSDEVCAMLASFYASEDALHASLQDAFYYPMIMTVMMFVLIIVLLSRVLPIFEQVFLQLGTSVSGIPSFLMDISKLLSRYYVFFILLFLGLSAAFFYVEHSPRGGRAVRTMMQKGSLTRALSEEIAISRFAFGLQLMLTSGASPYESLSQCRQLADNPSIEGRIDQCSLALENGSILADALAEAGIFSGFYSSMLRTASMTGNLDTVIGHIARHYHEDSQQRIDAALSRIEPAIISVLAVIVGLILLSVILPLMGIMSSIG